MKVILSRKGFDSSYGGYPSPILPDGTLLSLPIPEMKFSAKQQLDDENEWLTWDSNEYSPLTYSDLSLPQSVQSYFQTRNLKMETYQDILNALLKNKTIKEKGISYSNIYNWTCHFDPDIYHGTLKRSIDWCSLFGQGGKAEKHLRNQGVGKDDLFLFFGWFRKTLIKNGKLILDPNDSNGVHLIYGYMQIDYKITSSENRDKAQTWMSYHPHLRMKAWNNTGNAIYVGKKNLSWDQTKSGSGIFQYHQDLVLTDTSFYNNPRKNRTHWRKELFSEEISITYHTHKNHRTEKDEQGIIRSYFKAADLGQEFVMGESCKVTNWVYELLNTCKILS